MVSRKAAVITVILVMFAVAAYIIHTRFLFPTLQTEAQAPEEALRPVRLFGPDLLDEGPMASLERAVRKNLEYLDRLGPDHVFQYGSHTVSCRRVRETQAHFLTLLAQRPSPEALERAVKKDFTLYRATGRKGNRKVLFTGYFEPVYDGSLLPDETCRYPIYSMPDDLLTIDLSPFGEAFQGKRITARIEGQKVLPYHSRSDIEDQKVLADRGLEIAWLKDPLDVAFLHIQGSGRLRLPGGDAISVGYAGSNGRPYRSIGRYMLDHGFLTREEMSMQAIRRYLRDHPEVRDEVLNHNPSYIFFTTKPNGPFGNIQVQLTPGRSMAMDSRIFPKGALCFIATQKPVMQDDTIQEWVDMSRFMVNQDTGGAIRGAGRADIFWGQGPYAEMAAGHMKHEGDLYVLLLKKQE